MIETERLRLRGWKDDDTAAYAELHGDPHVAYWLGGRMSYEQALESLERNRRGIEERGWGLYAVERKEDGALLGVAGLSVVEPPIPVAQRSKPAGGCRLRRGDGATAPRRCARC